MKELLSIVFRSPKHRFLVAIVLGAMVLVTFASQLEIFALGVITNKGPSSGTSKIQAALNFINDYIPISENMVYLAMFLFLVAFFKAMTLFAHRFSLRLIAIRVSRDLRQDYFEHIQSLPMSFYQKHNIGSLSARVIGDTSQIGEAVNAVFSNYVQTPFTVVTTLILCFLTSWQLSLIVFLGFPAILFPIYYIAKNVKRIARHIQHNREKFHTDLLDFLGGIQTVKVFAMEDFSLKKYRQQNDNMANLEKRSARYDLASRPIVHTIGMSFLSITLLYGLYGLQMSIPDAFFFCGLLYVFYEPIKKFAEENSQIQKGVAAAERMFDVLRIKPQIEDEKDAEPLTVFEGPIEFDCVGFKYEDEWVLNNVSFTVKKGETVAIAGPTGAGKSTIVQLLPRLYDVQEGEIRINGRPIKRFTQKSLREMMAFVPQKPFLFYDTVNENIAFGRPFTPEQIANAAKKAHADTFIEALPQGYQTFLQETGRNLSGGQQQRLAIARALVKEAPILIMDEATSALDTVSEKRIKQAIDELRGSVTQVIIAHRLSTIQDADKIIYLDRGRKVAEGTKDELLKTCPGFRVMWETMHQSDGQLAGV